MDSVVTLPERYDFFLVSQSVRQGTVNPTSYNVIHDDIGKEYLGSWLVFVILTDDLLQL